jgi:hypothetical protein
VRRRYLLLGVPLLFWDLCAAAAEGCGDPPVVEDGKLKGELDGKAKILSQLLGGAELKGKFESERNDVLQRYPQASELRLNQYLLYSTCLVIMSDQNISSSAKIDLLIKARRAMQ